jgi:hypothetical protein
MTADVQACQYAWCRGHGEDAGTHTEHISKASQTPVTGQDGTVACYAVVDTNDPQDNEIYVWVQSGFDGTDNGTGAWIIDAQARELRHLIDTALLNRAEARGLELTTQ